MVDEIHMNMHLYYNIVQQL